MNTVAMETRKEDIENITKSDGSMLLALDSKEAHYTQMGSAAKSDSCASKWHQVLISQSVRNGAGSQR